MSNPQNSNSRAKLPVYALRTMLALAVLACLFVIVQSCSYQERPSLMRFAKEELKKMQVLSEPPAQPQMNFKMVDGTDISLKDFRGQTVLLNIWATWCAPCIAEIPSLDVLQKERGSANFTVVAVSMDRHIDDAKAFYADNKIHNLVLYHDPTFSLSSKVKVKGIPISILYDKNGREIARISGEVDWQGRQVSALLDTILTQN